jgi:predicted dehydrogenase
MLFKNNANMSRTSSRVRAAVVGIGEMGARHARVLASLPDRFEIVAIVDTRRDVARRAAEQLGTRATDLDAAIARAELVVFATPIDAHAAGAMRALAVRRHVLVEKPICARASEARRLVAAARAAGTRLFVGHSERFNPVVRALAERVAPGDVRALEHVRAGPPRGSGGAMHGGSALLNLGIHDVDLAAYLAGGPPVLVRAEGDTNRAELALAIGAARATVTVDRTAPERRRAVRLTTADAVYDGDLLTHRLTRLAGGRRESIPLADDEPLAAQLEAVHAAIGGELTAAATGEDGAHALFVVEAALAQIPQPPGLRAAEKL